MLFALVVDIDALPDSPDTYPDCEIAAALRCALAAIDAGQYRGVIRGHAEPVEIGGFMMFDTDAQRIEETIGGIDITIVSST